MEGLVLRGINNMKNKIENLIREVLKNLDISEGMDFSIEHPDDFKNGDYSTNVAMVYAKNLKINPKDLAEKIVKMVKTPSAFGISPLAGGEKYISKIEVAGPGFINFYLSREFFENNIKDILEKGDDWGRNEIVSGKKIMVEYTDPNPFKPFHIGHLMTNAIGESISRIVGFSGAKTIRANYQGDVGPHVAKAIYTMLKNRAETNSAMAEFVSASEKANWIGSCYSTGSNLYDTDPNIKKEIDEINKKIYDRSDEEVNKIYDWGREITLLAFEEIYKILGTKFDYYFFESEMAEKGRKVILDNVGKVFEESDKAIVFHGENYDPKLHTRVFINSQGLPTYEAKEVGLTTTKFEKENLDLSIVTTAVEQAEYMRVVQKALSIMYPELEKKMKHVTHGMMKLTTGKMSSRKGNVVTGESLLKDSIDNIYEKMKDREIPEVEKKEISRIVGISALKYSILKSSIGSDIVYDFEKSISFDGDSGPYLQYTAVRANSILEKSKDFNLENKKEIPSEVSDLERSLYKFPEVVVRSYEMLEPHHIVNYLTELASSFNHFYGNTQILVKEDPEGKSTSNGAGNKSASFHLDLIKAFYQTMKNGLDLLGIEVPERM